MKQEKLDNLDEVSEVVDLGTQLRLTTDIGFNRIFRERENMLSFINSALDGYVKGGIVDFQYGNPHRIGATPELYAKMPSLFELFCTTGKQKEILVEVQNVPSAVHFRQRIASYTNELFKERMFIKKIAKYPLYSIRIVDFLYKEDDDTDRYLVPSKLVCTAMNGDEKKDVTSKTVKNMQFLDIFLKHFKKEVHQLENTLEQWIFVLKNMHSFENLPNELNSELFKNLFEKAKTDILDEAEAEKYREEYEFLYS